ncbi:hypothetical protein AGMMS50256_29050 [Betaproteobacteria bacterium]|nr:hypothetical protein AGMMS50256_29050 [Betaproteobacteria bacterium]
MNDPVEQFRAALADRGIVPPEIIADGVLHRCDVEGKRGKGDAAYVLHLDGIPAGGFESWRDGLGWQNWRADIGRKLTPDEEATHKAITEAARREREADDAKRKSEAREACEHTWNKAKPASKDHPYLVKKGVESYGLKVTGNGQLLIPMRDTEGTPHSLQFIGPDGTKRFKTGGRKQGCYFAIGKPGGVLCICEGYATGASILQATGHAVAIAFDAGNLLPVAKALRAKLPDVKIIVCADDDWRTEGNPGLTKAREAARGVRGLLAVPVFGADRADKDTDFNDMAARAGQEAVSVCIAASQALNTVSSDAEPGGAPESDDAQTCPYGGGRFELSSRGVHFIGVDKDGNEKAPLWICSQLEVLAKTRDAKSNEWGGLLAWRDTDGKKHQWAMPLELLRGDGTDVRGELMRQGLKVSPNKAARDLLSSYLQVWPANARARCVDRLGWCGDVYVTPGEAIGQSAEIVVFQNAQSLEPAFSETGTLEGWREEVARRAAGNSRLVFALSAAFATPLLELANESGGGFHYRGASSTGKSTAQYLAASVWGHPGKYPRSWRATANGLEGLAALHNDGLLILDEFSQIDPRQAGEAAYMLSNGQGKTRAGRTGAARAAAAWRLLFLSSGEESLSAMATRANQKTHAGQEIRMVDIEADAGAGLGLFENIHESPTPAAFALALTDAATGRHGTVGMAWLRLIVENRAGIAKEINTGIQQFVEAVTPKDASGQVSRVARRFALCAWAGELATLWNLTGWQPEEAENAAKTCFTAWLSGFGGAGNREEREILSQVRAFFEAHGASRFEDMRPANLDKVEKVINRTGFFRTLEDGRREYLVLPEAFKSEVCKGLDPNLAAKVLRKAGWLILGEKEKRNTQVIRLPGCGLTRCYVFGGAMWEAES